MNRIAIIVLGAAFGVAGVLGTQELIHLNRVRHQYVADQIYTWAYREFPRVVSQGTPDARTLDTTWESGQQERFYKLRIVYETADGIKVLHTRYRVARRRVVFPTSAEIRRLDSAAPILRIH